MTIFCDSVSKLSKYPTESPSVDLRIFHRPLLDILNNNCDPNKSHHGHGRTLKNARNKPYLYPTCVILLNNPTTLPTLFEIKYPYESNSHPFDLKIVI